MQNLTTSAIAQIIIKILFTENKRMSENEIFDYLAKVNGGKHIDKEEVHSILQKLSDSEIRKADGGYYLSASKRQKLEIESNASNDRKNRILDKFFARLSSSRENLLEWLVDITIRFFESYSDGWISDLKAKTNVISTNGDSIRKMVTNRTNTFPGLSVEDKAVLPNKFFDFINTNSPEVNEFLWEFGTSAFASKLIRSKHGVDDVTLKTFENSHCILDTNVLMFRALENRYKGAFRAIENVFKNLGVHVSILHITKEEYEHTIGQQKVDTLANLEKLGYEVASLPNDDFTLLAKQYHCHDESDFVRFFDNTLGIPQVVFNDLPIEILDFDKLSEKIKAAQKNEDLKTKLNDIFKSFAKHDKPKAALSHDIGLLEGVKFLRENEDTRNEKFFILSEEISINQYSKSSPFHNGLPLSIRVDTLINLLAVNSEGEMFDASDYMPLFANIIRLGLAPHKDTFRQSELYQYYKMNTKIATLPTDKKKEIVIEMHKNMLDGKGEAELIRDLHELITDGEIQVGDKLTEVEGRLMQTNQDLNASKEQERITMSVLYNETRKIVESEYDRDTKRLRNKYRLKWLSTVYAIALFLVTCSYFTNDVAFIITMFFSVIASIIATMLVNRHAEKAIITERIRQREVAVNRITEERLNAKLALAAK